MRLGLTCLLGVAGVCEGGGGSVGVGRDMGEDLVFVWERNAGKFYFLFFSGFLLAALGFGAAWALGYNSTKF